MDEAKAAIAVAESFFRQRVQPSLVAIYCSQQHRPDTPVQTGTGFLVLHRSRPVLVTAKHVLRGKTFAENPAERAVHVNGRWVYIGDGDRELVETADRDLALTYMDEFPPQQCLSADLIATDDQAVRIITIGGFLARDFTRSQSMGVLQPSPLVFSNVREAAEPGLIGLRYSKRHNISQTGAAVVNSDPNGISGGPMLDTLRLAYGKIVIAGVFTEMHHGRGYGESAHVVCTALAAM